VSPRLRAISWLALLALAVVAGRVYLLCQSEYVYDEEEFKTGAIGAVIRAPHSLPLFDYQPGSYEGGTFLYGLLTIPFYRIIGQNFLSLKILALITTLLTVFAAVFYARRGGGVSAAVATGLLFLWPSAFILQTDLLVLGNYAENAMLTLVGLLFASWVLSAEKRSLFAYLALGVLLGFGVWVHYGFLVTVITILVLWWMINPRFAFSSRGGAVFAGMVLGFGPWILYNAPRHWAGIRRFTEAVNKAGGLGSQITGSFKRFFLLWWEDIPAGLHFHSSSIAVVKSFSYLYYLISLACIVVLLAIYRNNLRQMARSLRPAAPRALPDRGFWALAPVLYLLLYALIYSFSNYGIYLRQWGSMDPESHCHIFALYPPLLLIAGLAFGAAWPTRWKPAAGGGLAVLLVLGVIGFMGLLTPELRPAERLRRPIKETGVIFLEMGGKTSGDPSEMGRIQRRLDGSALYHFVYGAGIQFGLDYNRNLPLAFEKCSPQPENLRPYCWFGIGTGLYQAPLIPQAKQEALSRAPENIRPWMTLGACVGNIWSGQVNAEPCPAARQMSVHDLAPAAEAETLAVFIASQLVMNDARPLKK